MTRHRKSDPRWRDDASGDVMAACVPRLDLGPHVLVAGDASPVLRAALTAAGCDARLWLRRTAGPDTGAATAWPAPGPYSAALLRLPRAKDELTMMLHACAAQVTTGGVIAVYGANDEGIRSVAARMEPLLGAAETVDQRAHCRVIAARRPAEIPGLKAEPSHWLRTGRLSIGGVERAWVSYPGVFAHGGLDDGTRLLAGALAGVSAPTTVLDFGCGTGVIAANVQMRFPNAQIEMADWDALACLAAGQNVPGAGVQMAASLAGLGGDGNHPFDLIVSNPPIHDGKSEDYNVLGQLIAQAPARLMADGSLVLVVLRRVPAAEWLKAAFEQVETLTQDTRFSVWRASKPIGKSAGFRTPRGRSSGARGRAR